jgi:hypothetical protein
LWYAIIAIIKAKKVDALIKPKTSDQYELEETSHTLVIRIIPPYIPIILATTVRIEWIIIL